MTGQPGRRREDGANGCLNSTYSRNGGDANGKSPYGELQGRGANFMAQFERYRPASDPAEVERRGGGLGRAIFGR